MRQNLHRTDNLLISLSEDETVIEFEIRFSTSHARGTCDARCPRCGQPSRPQRWELEGPDGAGNTVWFECGADILPLVAEASERRCTNPLNWTRLVSFDEGWQELGG